MAGSMASIKGRFGAIVWAVFLWALYMPHLTLRVKVVIS